jgi:hypothetical protein
MPSALFFSGAKSPKPKTAVTLRAHMHRKLRETRGGVKEKSRMEDRGWKIEDGRSRMEDRGWKIEDGRSRMEDRGWKMSRPVL